jgi:thiamine pyrophosphokinase
VDASTDPQPDLGNASGGSDVTSSHEPYSTPQTPQHTLSTHALTHRFAQESFDACVFVGGESPHPFVAPVAQKCTTHVAADSGWRHALSIGVTPTVVLGDFDSITASELLAAREAQVSLFEYPSDKDFTDAEIAFQYVAGTTSESLLLVSGGGNRFDHLTSLLHALCHEHLTPIRRCAIIADTRIDIVTASHSLSLNVDFGQIVSLVPIGGDAIGVTTTGVRWPLQDNILRAHESRGISNVATDSVITVSVINGSLAVIQPHYFPPLQEVSS